MFKIRIIAVGKNKEAWVNDGIAHYLKLIKKHASVSIIYTRKIKKTKSIDAPEVLRREAPLIEKHLGSGPAISLSDRGTRVDSMQFAKYISGLMNAGHGSCEFIIGGAYGIDKSILKKSRDILSLSPMTMSHQLIRPVLLEQLYRAFSIISGEKYHK